MENKNQAEQAIATIAASMIPVGKNSKSPNGKYASFEDVIEALRQPFSDTGLSLSFLVCNGDIHGDQPPSLDHEIVLRFTHRESGDAATFKYPLPWRLPEKACGTGLKDSAGTAACQDYGKALTYTKRYALVMLFCMVTTERDPDEYEAQPRRGVYPPNHEEASGFNEE